MSEAVQRGLRASKADRTLRLVRPVVTRAAEKNTETGSSVESAPFCPRVFLLSAYRPERWLVGAVGIENNNGGDSMDLRGTRRSATSLKRNGKERKGMPIAPLMLPSFFSSRAFPSLRVFIAASNGKVGFGQNFCGTDGKPVPHST